MRFEVAWSLIFGPQEVTEVLEVRAQLVGAGHGGGPGPALPRTGDCPAVTPATEHYRNIGVQKQSRAWTKLVVFRMPTILFS